MAKDPVTASCLMCGKSYDVTEDHKDYPKLSQSTASTPAFVCDNCAYKIRHEADEKQKPKKPM